MTALTYRDGLSIFLLVIYVPSLFIAIFLCTRHGFRRGTGWLYLLFFSTLRILGAALQLATLSSPTNTSLWAAAATISSIGLSPLLLTSFGLAHRMRDNMFPNDAWATLSRRTRALELITMVALILVLVGGVKVGGQIATGNYSYPTESKVGLALFIVSWVGLAVTAAILFFGMDRATAHGEKRIIVAVALSLPFLFVRVLYSAIGVLGNVHDFSPITGSPTIYLVMALLMELIVVVIYEVVGLSLREMPSRDAGAPLGSDAGSSNGFAAPGPVSSAPPFAEYSNDPSAAERAAHGQGYHAQSARAADEQEKMQYNGGQQSQGRGVGGTLGAIGRHTLIGRAVMAVANSRN